MPRQAFLRVGVILKPQGLSGEVKLMPATDDAARFARLRRAYIVADGQYVEKSVLSARTREGFAYLKLDGVTDVEAAEALRGADLYVARDDAQPLKKGRYYIAELLGCSVTTDTGRRLGSLSDIRQAGGNDVYEVTRPGGDALYFPAVKDVFVSVDIDCGVIVLNEKRLGEIAIGGGYS